MSTNCSKSLQQEPHNHNQQQKPIFTNNINENLSSTLIQDWRCNDVAYWARQIECHSRNVVSCLMEERIDGEVLMELCEDDIRDLRYRLNYRITVGELKKLWLSIRTLQEINNKWLKPRNNDENTQTAGGRYSSATINRNCSTINKITPTRENVNFSNGPTKSEKEITYNSVIGSEYSGNNGTSQQCIPPDIFKTVLSMGYSFVVTWITSFVMVIVHERVPDMKRYPPLPDIFLDNVPHIPWAFHMCEITGTLLFSIWACVCIFHKHRMVLLRRFFALAGTVFLLRCVTMLITSLSVPGTHLQCNQKDYAIDDTSLSFLDALHLRVTRAYAIWSGLGMSIQGVRTCGDYMFSGHTVALTLLNFFITEYTPRNLYFLHTLTWLLNMFGIFFILAAHEHYSIDVFVAFYITSRLFLYYHTLANNQALMSRDSTRTRIWFPLFSYFESSVEGIVPNEYDSFGTLFDKIFYLIFSTIDGILLRARNFWLESKALGASVLFWLAVSYKFNDRTPLKAKANTPIINSHASAAAPHNAGTYEELTTAIDDLLQKEVNMTNKIIHSDDIKLVKKKL